jgi:hypothetical protein
VKILGIINRALKSSTVISIEDSLYMTRLTIGTLFFLMFYYQQGAVITDEGHQQKRFLRWDRKFDRSHNEMWTRELKSS